MVDGSIRALFSSEGMFDLLYINVLAGICAIT